MVDPNDNISGFNITVGNLFQQYAINGISDVPGLVADLAAKQTEINTNLAKRSFDDTAVAKLDGIEEGADRTDTLNVNQALGISLSGSRRLVLITTRYIRIGWTRRRRR